MVCSSRWFFVPAVALLLRAAGGCGGTVHNVGGSGTGSGTGSDGSGTGGSSGTGSSSGGCQGANPGCCQPVGPEGCDQLVPTATCSDGQWTCPPGLGFGPGECDDLCIGSGSGSGSGTEPFGCGDGALTCDPTTQFCSVVEGGAFNPDAGANMNASCQSIPVACLDVGTAAQCSCTIANQNGAGGVCSNTGDGFTITDAVP